MKLRSVAVLALAASQLANARNAAAPWESEYVFDPMDDSDRFHDFAKAIAHWGYSWEPFEVITRDGFKLTLFRITSGSPEGFIRPEISSSSESEKEE